MLRVSPRVAASAALAGALVATVPGSMPAHASSLSALATSSGLGVFARIGSVQLAVAQATYPEGPAEATAGTVALGTIGSAEGVTATASGNGEAARSAAEARVEAVNLDFGTAQLRTGQVRAGCSAGQADAPVGAVALTDAVLSLPDQPAVAFESTPEPNTVVDLPDGRGWVVLNEQISETDGSLTVNAFRLVLVDPESTHSSRLTLGSTNCRARTDTATLTGTAHDPDQAGVPGVVFEVVDQTGQGIGTCATDESGRCGVPFVPLEDDDAYVCVAEVPEGFLMPAAHEVCSGPYPVSAGFQVGMARPFELERSTADGTEEADGTDETEEADGTDD